MDKRRGDWFVTYSGIRFWPLDPRPDEILIEDIAHSLAHICRFGGHSRGFYSVAQHSVLVSTLVRPEIAMLGLMHDATEAYVGDMIRPLKRMMPDFKVAEDYLWKVIAKKYDLPAEMPPEIKRADDMALMTERRDVVTPPIRFLPWCIDYNGLVPDEKVIIPLGPNLAKADFLYRYEQLIKLESNHALIQ